MSNKSKLFLAVHAEINKRGLRAIQSCLNSQDVPGKVGARLTLEERPDVSVVVTEDLTSSTKSDDEFAGMASKLCDDFEEQCKKAA